jgi:hypothetical protein
MSLGQEVVLGNAMLWARSPMERMHGGIRVGDGKIRKIIHHDQGAGGERVTVDLQRMHIIPGLIDAHRHFFVTALAARFGDASIWKSKSDALDAIEAASRSHQSDRGWVFFSRMDHSKWKTPALPTLKEIDDAAHGLPAVVSDISLHRGIISTEAIRRTGLRRETLRWSIDIDINRDGTLKGTIWEDALGKALFTMYREMSGTWSEEEKKKIIIDEANRCLQMGLTRVHDPGIPSDVQRLLKEAQKDTPLKISWSITAYDSLCIPPEMKDEEDALHSDHAPKSVKFFLDGAHRTAADMPVIAGLKAALRAGAESITTFSPWPIRSLFEQKSTLRNGKIYLPYLRYEDVNDLITRAGYFAERGYRLVLHALGNVAASQAAHAVNELRMGKNSSIEHVLIMDNESLDTFAGCGAVASIQPGFIPHYADAIERQGAIPYLKVFPLRSLADKGVSLCISSDGPCGVDDPLHNIRRAVDRKKLDGSTLDPDERIGELQALAAGSIGGSRSLGLKDEGLTEGAPATFCVVDGDPFSDSSRVVQTWIDGRRVY